MKLLLVLAVVGVVWWWVGRAAAARRGSAPPADRPPQPQPMLACSHCGVHLPRADAVIGDRGAYCCAAHRAAARDGA